MTIPLTRLAELLELGEGEVRLTRRLLLPSSSLGDEVPADEACAISVYRMLSKLGFECNRLQLFVRDALPLINTFAEEYPKARCCCEVLDNEHARFVLNRPRGSDLPEETTDFFHMKTAEYGGAPLRPPLLSLAIALSGIMWRMSLVPGGEESPATSGQNCTTEDHSAE